MRLENGFGSVSKLSGKRNRPFIIKVTTGYEVNKTTGKKKQLYDIIGYCSTKKEGKDILKQYHQKGKFNQYMTFEELFEWFKEDNYPFMSASLKAAHNAAYKACASIHKWVFGLIDLENLQDVIDTCGKNYPTLRKIKLFLSQMYDYAIMNRLCFIDMSEGINITKYKDKNPNSLNRDKIKKSDIEILWKKRESKYYQMILFMIYTGVRVSEMLNLKKDDINIEESYFDVVYSKTEGGIRRVPICSKLMPYVKKWYSNEYNKSEYLFCTENGEHFLYRNYYDSYFIPLMEDCCMNYTPHFCRHTFISNMAEAEVNSTIIKKIVGHTHAMCLSERVYTHLDVKIMLDAVNKL